jgi:soluble lytic murein transglycosylase
MERLYEGDAYPFAIASAERLMRLAREVGAASPPAAVWRVAYPLVYGDLVQQQATETGVDPLLFLALVRQESRFDRRAVSYAGATGLTQVMPATGTWIAERLGVPGFAPATLTRPIVSVRFGVWYLDALLRTNDRDWVASLVGYNAGPGNLQRWTQGKPIADHDLFYETIPSQQPKDYVRLIYENYRTYQRLYAQTASPPPPSTDGP